MGSGISGSSAASIVVTRSGGGTGPGNSGPCFIALRAMARSISTRVTPLRFMISPARMNSGMAIRAKTSMFEKIFCGRAARKRVRSAATKASTAEPPAT